jgi:cation diffusion facilitator CzcD-associated flavoprotein CzcO
MVKQTDSATAAQAASGGTPRDAVVVGAGFAGQPEWLDYARHVAERFDLRWDIRFGTAVTAAHDDEASALWEVCTDRGERLRARFCIMATGCLSASRMPVIEGIADYQGKHYHTGRWPHEGVDFSGQRVGVIGTGSSGIQAIPMLAQQAQQLLVFHRTANFSVPARSAPMDDTYERSWKEHCRQGLRQGARTGAHQGAFGAAGRAERRQRAAVVRARLHHRARADSEDGAR